MDVGSHRLPAMTVAVTAVVLGGAALADLSVFNPRTPTGRMLIGEAVLLVVLAWAVRRSAPSRPTRGAVLGLVAAVSSLAATVVLAQTVWQRTPGLVAASGLATIVVLLCRYLPARWLAAVPAVAVAVLAMPARLPPEHLHDLPGGAATIAAVLVSAAVATGLLLRSGDVARRAAEESLLREERVRLAHDLHDDVAHHVTGVVVAAQAGAQVVVGDPERGRALFERIESAGQDGLTAINRAVRLLRTADRAGAAPPPTLDDVRDIVDRFSHTDLPATLDVADGIDARSCSAAGWTLVGRVVQEGLTNVRKHAGAATTVAVSLAGTTDGLAVSVHDNGGRTRRRPRLPSGGVGLTGLSEQVRALGGELTYGHGDGGGWTVAARIPGDHA